MENSQNKKTNFVHAAAFVHYKNITNSHSNDMKIDGADTLTSYIAQSAEYHISSISRNIFLKTKLKFKTVYL